MKNQESLSSVKELLFAAEDDYAHGVAAGDWVKVTDAKQRIAKYRRVVGWLVKEKLKAGQ